MAGAAAPAGEAAEAAENALEPRGGYRPRPALDAAARFVGTSVAVVRPGQERRLAGGGRCCGSAQAESLPACQRVELDNLANRSVGRENSRHDVGSGGGIIDVELRPAQQETLAR